MDNVTVNPTLLEKEKTVSRPAGQLPFHFTDIIRASIKLAVLLRHETALVRASKIRDTQPLQDDKQKLTRLLELQKEHLKNNPQLLRQLSPELRQQLRDAEKELTDALRENHTELLVARTINQRVVDAVMRAVDEAAGKVEGYNRYGTSGIKILSYQTNTPAVAFNQSV